MNEKLEYEIAGFSGRISLDKVKKQPFGVLDECARYFYNLALQDVRKEIRNNLFECRKYNNMDRGYYCGRILQSRLILKSVDNLTK